MSEKKKKKNQLENDPEYLSRSEVQIQAIGGVWLSVEIQCHIFLAQSIVTATFLRHRREHSEGVTGWEPLVYSMPPSVKKQHFF